MAEQRGFAADSARNDRKYFRLRGQCFIKAQKHFQREYSFELELWESKRERVTTGSALCIGCKRRSMVCAPQVKGKLLGMLMAGLQLPC